MLQQLFHITILSAICMVWGIPVLLILLPAIKKDNFWYHSLPGLLCFLFFCGCISISLASSWIYLWLPLQFFYLALLTLLLIVYLFWFQRRKIVNVFRESNRSGIRILFVPLLFIIISLVLF